MVPSVNYFGHAAVASWAGDSPGVGLGAMLPDFASMSRAQLAGSPDAEVTMGLALHHRTDKIFHQLAAVTAQMRELDVRLLAHGCARGPRRAVAHIGVELLLDGVLLDEPAYQTAYTRALAFDAPITWRDPGDAARFATLLDRLRAHGVPADLRRPDALTHRIGRILGHRPLLAPSAADLVAIRAALGEHQPHVAVAADAILRGLRAQLTGSDRGSSAST